MSNGKLDIETEWIPDYKEKLMVIKPALTVEQNDLQLSDEIIDKRTVNTKTYKQPDGDLRTCISYEVIHYKDDYKDSKEPWKEIDLSLTDNGTTFTLTNSPYTLEVDKNLVKYSIISKRGGRVDVELIKLNDEIHSNTFDLLHVDNRVYWNNLDGIDIQLVAYPKKVVVWKRIRDEKSPKKLEWKIREDVATSVKLKRDTFGWDNENNNAQITNSLKNELIKKSTITNKDYKEFSFVEEWTGKISKVGNESTRQKEWKTKPTYPVWENIEVGVNPYPVLIDVDATTTIDINAEADDVYDLYRYQRTLGDTTTLTFFSTGKVKAGKYGTSFMGWNYTINAFNAGLRFQDIPIPQGTNIVSATFKIKITAIAGAPLLKIYGNDIDNAPAWADPGNLPKNINKTAANLAWTPNATGTVSNSVTSIVQEIISRTGWATSNELALGILQQMGENWEIINKVATFADYPDAGMGSLIIVYPSAAPPPAVLRPTVAVGNPLIF